MRIAILGAGAWGTALAASLGQHHPLRLWARNARQAREIQETRENRRYLPGHHLPPSVQVDPDLHAAVAQADLVLAAVPLAALRTTMAGLHATGCRAPLLWACKGFEPETGRLAHRVVAEELGEDLPCGALTGPSFAEEVARGLPTAVTLAARDLAFATATVRALNTPRLRLYASDDLVAAEVGGAVKNVMAIAAGVADGLGFGLNARAALVTRGLAEIARLGAALGARRESFMGLAGLGDLVLTCTGDLSRNRRVGLALAEGRPLDDILAGLGHTAEGVGSAREAARLAGELGVDMPITRTVCGILFEGLPPQQGVEQLLARDPKQE
ncbi:MAG: NAD(P)-dependent glycerol-3-phosphate dehydrogenase [Betaproteobacteria bacterium]|nr:NAD(P)-dependent glycerol-3-phosphate dehydrogenase [Betaproteobacteria bacterium]